MNNVILFFSAIIYFNMNKIKQNKNSKKYLLNKLINNLFKTISILFLFFTISFSNTLAQNVTDTNAKTVENAFSENYDAISKISQKTGIKILTQENKNSINEFIQIVAYFESKLNKRAYNKYSGANSYFQFLNSSFRESRDYIRKNLYKNFPYDSSVRGYSYQGQSQMTMSLWYNHARWKSKNYKNELKGLFNRNYNSGMKVYCSYHHTNCSGQLSYSRNRALRTALKNWSKDKYFIGTRRRKSQAEYNSAKYSNQSTKISKKNLKIVSKNTTNIQKDISGKTNDEKIKILKQLINNLQKTLIGLQSKAILDKAEAELEIKYQRESKKETKKRIEPKKITKKEKNKKVAKEEAKNNKDFYCKPLIDYYISPKKYKSYDAIDLENFLNKYENENLKLNGVFDKKDIEAVKRFQLKYKKDILEPWNEKKPTGYVFKTTKNKINSLYCEYKKKGNGIKIY